MVTRDRVIQNLPRPMASTLRPALRRWLLIVLVSVSSSLFLAVENDAEIVDSGWAVATPSTIATAPTPHDPKQQMILYHVLEQTRRPLLRNLAPPQTAESKNEPALGNLRIAVRPDGIEGWRPSGQIIAPLGESWQSQVSTPQLDTPTVNQPAVGGESSGSAVESSDSVPGPQTPDAEPSAPPTELVIPESAPPEEIVAGPSGEVAGNVADGLTVEQPIGTEMMDESAESAPGPQSIDSAESSPAADPGPPPLTKQLINLRSRVRNVLKGYYKKTLNSREHDPWEVMHGMLAYGVHSRIRQGGPRGEPVTSVGWLCYNKPCKGLTLMHVTPKGELRAKYGVGLQGHLGQLLAMLAQCRVSAEYPIRVGKREFTIQDLIEAEKKTCYPKSELTFKLLAFQYYLDLNDKWVNDQGLEWDIPRVIREELAQPIRGAACGGTHRLSSLSLTVKARVRRGESLDGQYARAAEFVKKYHQYAFRLQNRDGSLSTAWFNGRGDEADVNRRIKTTGHILEWLCYSLSDEELRDQRTIRAVSYLANLMYSKYDNEWEVGPMCHATHALLLYDERVFRPFDDSDYDVAYTSKPTAAKHTQQNSRRR